MTRLVALTSGSAAETVTFDEPRHRAHLAGVVYTGDAALGGPALDDADGVWVPEGTPRRRMRGLAARLDGVLARGGTVLLFGDHQSGWPGCVDWTYRPAGGAGETQVGGEWSGTELGVAAGRLHHHGVLAAPQDTQVLLAAADGAPVAYLHRPDTGGTVFVSSIDPLAHFGHTGAAESARFLEAFLPWVTGTLLTRGDGR